MMMCARVSVAAGLLFFMSACLQEQLLEACSCYPTHPQQLFCSANIVIKAKILDKKPTLDNGTYQDPEHLKSRMKVMKVFKGTEDDRIEHFFTPAGNGMCGVKLGPGVYLLSGTVISGHLGPVMKKGVLVGLCDLVERWDSLSKTVKRILSLDQNACNCKISYCFQEPCATSENECTFRNVEPEHLFEPTEQDLQSVCMTNRHGICSWISTN